VNWRRGRLAEAAAELYDLLQNAPNDLDARCLLAEVLSEQKRYKAARAQFERALEIDPTCAWASQGLKELKRADVPRRTTPKITSAKIKRT
jgi:tetratricopeptide (TPR) repeat protein